MARLLDSLREAGAHEQAAALAGRAAAHAALDDPDAVAACWTPAAGGRARAGRRAAGRAAAHAALDDPDGVACLLGSLREAGAHEQAAALAGRAAAHVALDDPGQPWPACWTACWRRARTSRPPRWPADCRQAGMFDLFLKRKASRISSVSAGSRRYPGRAMGLGRPGLWLVPQYGPGVPKPKR